MRISTRQIQQLGIDSILGQHEKLTRTQLQVATGQRILLPSDDPVGTSQLLQLRQSLDTTKQYQANADAATNRLSQEEGVLASVTELLQSVRVLAVQGGNASQTNETRGFMAAEIRQRLDELLGLANTRDGTGDYLFSGTMGSTQPFIKDAQGNYIYEGDQSQRSLQIGAGRKVADGDPGSEIFQLIRNGNGTFAASPTGNAGVMITPNDPANPPLVDSVVVGAQYFPALDGYEVVFNDPANYDILDAAGNTVASSVPYTSPHITIELGTPPVTAATVTLNGLSPAPVAGDTFTLDLTETRGTGIIGETTVVDGNYTRSLPGGYTLTFSQPDPDGPITYQVTDSGGNPVGTPGTYIQGQPIEFQGARLAISGTPAHGDTFSVRSSEYQNIFQTLENLAAALDTPVQNAADQAQLNNGVNRALGETDLALENVLVVRASVGARLNAIDSQSYVNEGYLVQAEETLSSIEDLDYAEALSRLHMQMAGLEAAQQAYIKVNGLSMFNYLK